MSFVFGWWMVFGKIHVFYYCKLEMTLLVGVINYSDYILFVSRRDVDIVLAYL